MASCKINKKAAVLYPLLRLALNTTPEVPQRWDDLLDLSQGDWAGLLRLSRQQAVVGLVYDALSKLPPEMLRNMPASVGSAFILETDRMVRKNKEVSAIAHALLEQLNSNGISALLMKGPSVGAFYPAPELRTPGDIDLYCPARQLQALSLIKSPDGSSHCKINGIDIDIHAHYFDFEVPGREYPPVPSPYATLLMLSSHILKHAMGPGVGLRQICDMAMAYRALSGQYDMMQLRSLFQAHGLLRWNILLSDFITRRLGLDIRLSGKAPASIAPLEDIVFSGGNFGHFDTSRARALSHGGKFRKADTLLRFAGRLPFALKYAPRQYCHYLGALLKGNMGLSVSR